MAHAINGSSVRWHDKTNWKSITLLDGNDRASSNWLSIYVYLVGLKTVTYLEELRGFHHGNGDIHCHPQTGDSCSISLNFPENKDLYVDSFIRGILLTSWQSLAQ